MCYRPQSVTVGDPTTTQITEYGLIHQELDQGITESEAWCAVALTTLGALLAWVDTGRAAVMLIPVFLLLFFSQNEKQT